MDRTEPNTLLRSHEDRLLFSVEIARLSRPRLHTWGWYRGGRDRAAWLKYTPASHRRRILDLMVEEGLVAVVGECDGVLPGGGDNLMVMGTPTPDALEYTIRFCLDKLAGFTCRDIPPVWQYEARLAFARDRLGELLGVD